MTALSFSARKPALFPAPMDGNEKKVLPLAPRLRAQNVAGEALPALHEAERLIESQAARIRALESLLTTDELTGLLNKRGLVAALRRELVVSRRTEKQAGLLILINVDDFKQINELYGHDVGDSCLQNIGSVLINEVRSSDYVARMESDTFAVLVPHIAPKAAGARLDKLERTLGSRVMHSRSHAIPLRASLGFSVLHEMETPESLLMSADKKLHISKARRKMGMKG